VYKVSDGSITNDIGYTYSGWGDNDGVIKFLSSWYKFEKVEERKMFTKDGLRENDWCVLRDGTLTRVVEFNGRKHFIGKDYWNQFFRYDENLFNIAKNSHLDVMKVFRPERECDLKESRYELAELIFDRAAGIGNEPPVKEITVAEAEKALTEKYGENVKIRVGE